MNSNNNSDSNNNREEVHAKIKGMVSERDFEVLVPLLDRLQILGKMSRSGIGQALAPTYKVSRWREVVEKAIKLGILHRYWKEYFTQKGRVSNACWFETAEEYRYEPLWVSSFEEVTNKKQEEEEAR